ncbi:MAG: AAA family ATPase [Prevotella sp.]|nr:AAA family ATPase [Prevotella sp.]
MRDMDSRQAGVCFEEVGRLLDMGDSVCAVRYDRAYRLFVNILDRLTVGSSLLFSGTYSKLDFVVRRTAISNDLLRRLNAFRCRATGKGHGDEDLNQTWPYDIKALCLFIAQVCKTKIPEELVRRLPASFPPMEYQGRVEGCIRGVVTKIDGTLMHLQPIDMDAKEVVVCCSEDSPFGDFAYVLSLVRIGTRVNVVKPVLRDGVYHPQLMVVMPDMLIDISSVAACFESYADTYLIHLLRLFSPAANSQAILLGNFAGQLLDEVVHNDNQPLPYAQSARSFFKQSAMRIATCPDMQLDFHANAVEQQKNICNIVSKQLPQLQGYAPEKVLLEPSFFCEMLGLQGRMDFLQTDLRVLVEQKSGKKDWKGGHVEKHYVQVLLYQALLHYNYDIPNNQIESCLLYSKYPDGLIKEGPAPQLLFEAMRIRNHIAAMMEDLAEGKGRELLDTLTPERLKEKTMSDKFWTTYIRPEIDAVLAPLHHADKLTSDYFHRMLAFVAKEHILAKVGTPGREASGLAALWNASLGEKQSAGNILTPLVISCLHDEGIGRGITEVTLSVEEAMGECLPNFRESDAVVLHSFRRDAMPDATHTMVFRGSMMSLEAGKVTIALRAPQKNKAVFHMGDDNVRWAVEHDNMETTFTTLYRSVASILKAGESRRRLLLAQRPPEVDKEARPTGGKTTSPQLLSKFVKAKDYFLLIGPPGTGKTSLGLVAMLQEELSRGGSVLLLSFTNRAVNEICSKLVEQGMDFLRLGSPLSCPERYHDFLLGKRAENCVNIQQVKNMISTARVMVSTTSTMLSNVDLFSLRSFSLAIVDEASQILEPHLLGILCARHGQVDAISRFVLIGDHKQLPAVVQQSENDSSVSEKRLRDIGLCDCRLSLFERLLKINAGRDDVVFHFTKQGRMHHDVAGFANKAFYKDMLEEVPLKHQVGDLVFPHVNHDDQAQHLLASTRLLFVASHQPDRMELEKVNEEEAHIIAKLVHAVYCLYGKENSRTFDPDSTVGVIVPYRHQIATIQRELGKYGIPQLMNISIDTVERFQGSQRDVIIYGFTVKRLWQLDFLTANVFEEDGCVIDRKLNVALTRAREQMVVVGNPALLQGVEVFAKLIDYCKTHGVFCEQGL